MRKKIYNVCPLCNGNKYPTAKMCKKCNTLRLNNKPGALWQNREWLKKQYFDNKLSFRAISKITSCTDKTVQYFFRKFNLVARPPITLGLNGKENPNWKGGRVYDARGYVKIFYPESHPYKSQKYVLEHILVMEKKLGRHLKHPEVIHHNNGIPDDNRPENLKLFSNPTAHNTYEQAMGLFAKHILYNDLAPHLRLELQDIFQKFISSFVNEQ